MAARGQLSPVVIAILALLAEEPMHAYRMQQLIKERGVDIVVNVRNRSGLHTGIERLARDGLIRVHAVERDTRHPERTVYELTPDGRAALLAGLRDGVATPSREFPLFPAVVSFLHLLDPAEVGVLLARRADAVRQRLAGTGAVLAASVEAGVPRLHLLEHEYTVAVGTAELTWLDAVARDITAGTLDWQRFD